MYRYTKKYARRRRRPRRQAGGRSLLDYKVSLRSMWNQLKYIKSLVNVEFKKYDGVISSTIGTTPALALVPSAIPQGDTDQTRNGNSIKLKSLLLKGQFSMNVVSTGTQMCRLLVVMDKQQVGDTAPAFSDIVDQSFSNDIYAPLNNETVGRFTVLLDKVYSLQPNGATLKNLNHYIRLSNHIRYNGANSGDIQKNGIYCFVVSNDNINQPTYQLVQRLTFIDN